LVFFQRATQTTIKKGEIPAITDIIKTKKNKFQQNLNAIVESEGYKSTLEFAQQLLQDKEPDHVVAALIKIAYENEFNEHNYRALDKVQMGNSGVNNGM
jgi:ATP-dependent RNA helicase DeaD